MRRRGSAAPRCRRLVRSSVKFPMTRSKFAPTRTRSNQPRDLRVENLRDRILGQHRSIRDQVAKRDAVLPDRGQTAREIARHERLGQERETNVTGPREKLLRNPVIDPARQIVLGESGNTRIAEAAHLATEVALVVLIHEDAEEAVGAGRRAMPKKFRAELIELARIAVFGHRCDTAGGPEASKLRSLRCTPSESSDATHLSRSVR
jgi:hypothetical protein